MSYITDSEIDIIYPFIKEIIKSNDSVWGVHNFFYKKGDEFTPYSFLTNIGYCLSEFCLSKAGYTDFEKHKFNMSTQIDEVMSEEDVSTKEKFRKEMNDLIKCWIEDK